MTDTVIASVKEVCERIQSPTINNHTCRWDNLYETIEKVSNLIHKDSLWRPANLVIGNKNTIKKLYDKKLYSSVVLDYNDPYRNFSDAEVVGLMGQRYQILVSSKECALRDDVLLVCLIANGTEMALSEDKDGVQVVNVTKSTNPHKAAFNVGWWSFIEIVE